MNSEMIELLRQAIPVIKEMQKQRKEEKERMKILKINSFPKHIKENTKKAAR